MKTKLQRLQKQLKKINKEISHSQNVFTEIDIIEKNGCTPFPFWNKTSAQDRIDLMLSQRDTLLDEIASLKTNNCSIL